MVIILWVFAIATTLIQFLIGYLHQFSLGFFIPVIFTFFIVWVTIHSDHIGVLLGLFTLIMGFLWYSTLYIKGRNYHDRKLQSN